jgi:hypothetical protein
MSAIYSTLPRLPLAPSSVERGKPVASVSFPRPVPNRQPAPRQSTLFTIPNEPEDARITGGTRSLERRLLALNLARPSEKIA